jgi:hypothetical protein
VSESDDLRRENEELREKVARLEADRDYEFNPRKKMRDKRRDAAAILEQRQTGRHFDGGE